MEFFKNLVFILKYWTFLVSIFCVSINLAKIIKNILSQRVPWNWKLRQLIKRSERAPGNHLTVMMFHHMNLVNSNNIT